MGQVLRTGTTLQVACQQPPWPLLAPRWHTRALLVLLLGVPLFSLSTTPGSALPPEPHAVMSYLPSVLVSVALAGYVSRFGLPRSVLSELLGEPWRTPRRAILDAGLAVGVASLVLLLDAALTRLLTAPESIAAHALIPATPAQRLAWLLFAVAAGVGEELVYRGYLQQQLTGSLQSPAAGVVLQALLFGVAHGEQGGAVVARFALYGALFGVLTLLRRSLAPAIVAHVALDVYAGFAR